MFDSGVMEYAGNSVDGDEVLSAGSCNFVDQVVWINRGIRVVYAGVFAIARCNLSSISLPAVACSMFK